MRKFRKKFLKFLYLAFLLFLLGRANIFAESDEEKIMVSLGDSYSSGEGNFPYYSKKYKPNESPKSADNLDWLAHRSEDSWPGKLRLKGMGPMKDYKDQAWFFKAASGAVTRDLGSEQEKVFWDESFYEKTAHLPEQVKIFDDLKKEGKKVSYVTLTIGGNDVGFSDIITTAAMSSYDNPNALKDKLDQIWENFNKKDGIKKDIYDAYNLILKKAGPDAHLIVAGYPRLFDVSPGLELEADGELPLTKYTMKKIIDEKEAEIINQNVTLFNQALSKIVDQCKSEGKKISFVDVESEFWGHGAYAADPYIHGINIYSRPGELKSLSLVSAKSIHPNKKGCEAYARCLQREIDRLESMGNVNEDGHYLQNNFSLELLDKKGNSYDNYILEIYGKSYRKFLFFKFRTNDFYKKIDVTSSDALKLKLNHGTYNFKFTDKATGESIFLDNINIFESYRDKNLKINSNFGENKEISELQTKTKEIQAKKNDFASPSVVEDEEYMKVYKEILESKRPYKIFDNEDRIYIKDIYEKGEISFAIYKHKDFAYPLLIIRNQVHYDEDYNSFAIVQYQGQGDYKTFSELEMGSAGISSNAVYKDTNGDLYIDNSYKGEFYYLEKSRGRLIASYGFSREMSGPLVLRGLDSWDDDLKETMDRKSRDGIDGLSKYTCIDEGRAEIMTEEFFSRINSLKEIEMFPAEEIYNL